MGRTNAIPKSPRLLARLATLLIISQTLSVLPGCALGTLIGGMAASARRHGSHTVYAEYEGLKGKSFAVVVAADRVIDAEHAGLTTRLMERINNSIARAHAQMPDGAVAAPRVDRLLKVLYNNPQWTALPRKDVADMLGVDRLIVVDLAVYRLHEPGNAHLWNGVAAGSVSVIEADSPVPDEAVFERAITVSFPDGTGYSVNDIPYEAVNTELSNRFANRVAWLFFDHEEPNEIKY
ncbi:MAG: hypothetical protein D6695_07550 [Planctomycetota bacterium]|nr:MAG: hypothetical protein D6695_07550 [Planctomycetota bacterium]